MNNYAFGNFLFTLRTEKGLSQTQLGEMLGVTNKAVSKWENGSAMPNTALLPNIAEIFSITVEELFACKRIEQAAELENLKNHLRIQKRRAALRTSVFLSLVTTLPLFLFDFIYVMASFATEDEVIGPIGSVGIIITFIISVTGYIIHRGNFKHTITSDLSVCDEHYISLIRKCIAISVCSLICLFVILIVACILIYPIFAYETVMEIITSCIFVLMTVSIGIFVCCQSLKRLHKIKIVRQRRKILPFKQWPLWSKICYISALILFPLSFPLPQFNALGVTAKGLSVVLLTILFVTRKSRTE